MGRKTSKNGIEVSLVKSNDPDRAEVCEFIRTHFNASYNSVVTCFMPQHIVARKANGDIIGVIGFRNAADEKLFLEAYLSASIEDLIDTRFSCSGVARCQIVEVGNLASISSRATRLLYQELLHSLARQEALWVACTACETLRVSMAKLGLCFEKVSPASANSLTPSHGQWGTYFDKTPNVLVGNLRSALTTFAQQN